MRNSTRLSVIAMAAILSACGGGGGGGAAGNSAAVPGQAQLEPVKQSAAPAPVVPPPFSLSPSVLSASYVVGNSTARIVEAKQEIVLSSPAFLTIVTEGPFLARLDILPQSDFNHRLMVHTSPDAKPGRYTGNVTVNVCTDASCATHVAGSPFKYPYDIKVRPLESQIELFNSKPLSPLPGAGDWETFQGNAQHTGYVPVTLSPAAFSARWKWTAGTLEGHALFPSALASGGGRIYFSADTVWRAKNAEVLSLNEHDGSLAWRFLLPDQVALDTNAPAYSNGKVYTAAGGGGGTAMYAFDAAMGNLMFKSPMEAQTSDFLPPIVVNGNVYTEGGQYGGMYSFNAASGARNFFTKLSQDNGWSPASDGSKLYTFNGYQMNVADPVTGVVSATIQDPNRISTSSRVGAGAVVGTSGLVFAGRFDFPRDNAITAFDPVTKSVRWSVPGDFVSNPAYADATLFATNFATGQLQAMRETDGAVSWTWKRPAADDYFVGNVLLTRNLVFVSTDKAVYAVDRSTHQAVWSYPASGTLALSKNGVLYVSNDSGITAINLR